MISAIRSILVPIEPEFGEKCWIAFSAFFWTFVGSILLFGVFYVCKDANPEMWSYRTDLYWSGSISFIGCIITAVAGWQNTFGEPFALVPHEEVPLHPFHG